MGEIKSVKVDNWGVFFLQKLQNFFNKTDYCDLTLQFRDNSQLKVHRLVLSACTDYFNVLENTCEVVDDALIMPNELQADVVVPIVNFMYTGTLEFELRMYGKLLRTAKEMNMTVLLKLLEAHRRTMEGVNRSQRPPSPKTIRRRGPHAFTQPSGVTAQQQQHAIANQAQTRKLATSANSSPAVPQQLQRRVPPTKTAATSTVQTQIRQLGQTTLMRTTTTANSGATQLNQFKQDSGSNQSPSTFEQLRKGYNNNKRPAPVNFVSPPAKKPNIEDVKEFAEQQRMRKQIAAEYADDPDYEGTLDDDIHADDDDDDATAGNSMNASGSSVANATKSPQQEVGETTITFKQEEGGKPPTILVKDTSNSKVNHAKIISEVLRQYPHLAKSNKNIKLKIMPNAGGQAQKIIVKRDVGENAPKEAGAQKQTLPTVKGTAVSTSSQTTVRAVEKTAQPSAQQQQAQAQQKAQQLKVQAAGSGAALRTAVSTVSPQTMHTTPSTGNAAKRRIDSKTMHALISLGAENMNGPWLCLRCGVNGRPISIPTYRGFRRHLVNTHKEAIDAALCEHCGWRSNNNRELHFHMQVEHKVRSNLYSYPECLLCAELFLDNSALNQHMLNSHPNANKQQCIYCNKIFGEESQLFTHMKAYHKRQALEDGIIDYSDEEFVATHDQSVLDAHHAAPARKKETKVKILSDISLPSTSAVLKLERSSEAAALSTVASGIATSIAITSSDGTEEFISAVETEQESGTSVTRFVNADGNEMVLTDELRKEIMSQLNQEHEVGSGGVVMVLNDNAYVADETTTELEEHLQADTEQHDSAMDEGEATAATAVEERHTPAEVEEYDDSQIYGEFISQESSETASKKSKEHLEESKESIENMEWAESLLSAHEMADEAKTEDSVDPKQSATEEKSKNDDISKKLQELTGDWSEDENDVEEHAEQMDEGDAVAAAADEDESADATDKPRTSSQSGDQKPESTSTTADLTEIKPEDETAKTNIGESPMEEDDLELAMENLHKEDAETKPSPVSTTSNYDSPHQVSMEDEKLNEADLVAELKDESPEKPKTQEVKPKIADDESALAVEETAEATNSPLVDCAAKEEEDLANALLDELITKKTVEDGIEAVDEKPSKIEAITTCVDTDIVEDEGTPIEDPIEKVDEIKEESVDEVHPEEFIEEKDESSTKDEEVADETSNTAKAETSDKMKSLISEWADDDDDEHEEIGDAEIV